MADRAEKCAEEIYPWVLAQNTPGAVGCTKERLVHIIRSHYPDDRELLEAAKEIKPLFVVEGEKEDDNYVAIRTDDWKRLRTAIAKAERRG